MKPKTPLPPDVDVDCRRLCAAMNRFPGIRTIESCSGHGKKPYHIWFKARRLKDLPRLLYWFPTCHSGLPGWCVFARTDCTGRPLTFLLEGPVDGASEATHLAMLIELDADRMDDERRHWLRNGIESVASRLVCLLTHRGKPPEGGPAAYCYWCGRPIGFSFWPFPRRVT